MFEPTEWVEGVVASARAELGADKTLVMVEHDMGVVFGLADRISVVVYGEIIAIGSPAEIRANVAVKEAYLGAQAEAA